MAYVIAEPCITKKDTACVLVCPVDCIHPRKDTEKEKGLFEVVEQLYIDPDVCIDCGACVPECPVAAIFPADDLKAEWKSFAEKNADWYKKSAADFQAKWGSAGKSA
jgi:ferredoxin